jgi:hypothetical protein
LLVDAPAGETVAMAGRGVSPDETAVIPRLPSDETMVIPRPRVSPDETMVIPRQRTGDPATTPPRAL